jgi:CRISPR-associated protein Cas8b/Csh1 subtype I-B
VLTTLYQFADLLKDQEDLKVYFSPAENPFEGGKKKGKVLVGEIEDGGFKRFSLEDFRETLIPHYLYRKIAPNGTGVVPTLFVNQNVKDKKGKTGIEKTKDKLISCLANNSDVFKIGNSDLLVKEFEDFPFDSSYSYIVTFKVDKKWIGEIDALKKRFYSVAYNKYFQQSSKGTSLKANQVCSITGKISTVYGFVNTLGFAVDAKSFMRNGFDVSDSYKMFPVSKEAIPILEGARGMLLHKISDFLFQFYDEKSKSLKKFSNIKYALVPHFVFMPTENIAKEIAQKYLTKAAFKVDAGDQGLNGFLKGTESILQAIIDDGDLQSENIYYDIILFEQKNAQFMIHSEIADVLPSRISKVLQAKKKSEERYKAFTSYRNKDGNIVSQKITLFRLREYFTTGKALQPAYFKLVNNIFSGQGYDDDSKLLGLIVETWKSSFKKNFHSQEKSFNYLVKHTLGNLYFLYLLGIFKKHTMNNEIQNPKFEDAFTFIEAHSSNYFTKQYLKGAFLFGCLVNTLLKEQPGKAFMKELNGLNIDKDLIAKKFPKLINKLRQYGKNIPDMEIAASRYFAANDPVAKDEISFAFTLGLVLQKDFRDIYYANKKNNIQNPD